MPPVEEAVAGAATIGGIGDSAVAGRSCQMLFLEAVTGG